MFLDSETFSCLPRVLDAANLSNSTLESVAVSIKTHFSKADYFRVGNALVRLWRPLFILQQQFSPQTMLLQHKDLLHLSSQRIAAIFLLNEFYRSDTPSGNPFAQFFIELLQPHVEDDRTVAGVACGHSLSAIEKWFLAHLLTSLTPKDVSIITSS